MDVYSAKWKRLGLFSRWKTEKDLIGHRYEKDQNKMVFFYKNGSVKEVAEWLSCEIHLGTDWVLWTKNSMEKEANQAIKLNVQPG